MSLVVVAGKVYRQAADPARDRAFRDEARSAWEKLKAYMSTKPEINTEEWYEQVPIPFGAADPQYSDLVLVLESGERNTAQFSLSDSNDVEQDFILTLNLLNNGFWRRDYEDQQRALHRVTFSSEVPPAFLHEFIHYLDARRRKTPEDPHDGKEPVKSWENLPKYLSQSHEYNAWYQMLIAELDDRMAIQSNLPRWASSVLPSFEDFMEYLEDINRRGRLTWHMEKLNRKYQRKLKKRLYGLYQHLREELL